ncbi:MAG: hypothetical protein ACRCXZ_05485 [Patescibacteria group bacterium]
MDNVITGNDTWNSNKVNSISDIPDYYLQDQIVGQFLEGWNLVIGYELIPLPSMPERFKFILFLVAPSGYKMEVYSSVIANLDKAFMNPDEIRYSWNFLANYFSDENYGLVLGSILNRLYLEDFEKSLSWQNYTSLDRDTTTVLYVAQLLKHFNIITSPEVCLYNMVINASASCLALCYKHDPNNIEALNKIKESFQNFVYPDCPGGWQGLFDRVDQMVKEKLVVSA